MLPSDALVDNFGRRPCYAHVHRRCHDPDRGRYHGPLTRAMQAKRLVDEKRMANNKVASAERTRNIFIDDDGHAVGHPPVSLS